jgi:hypothetical protein
MGPKAAVFCHNGLGDGINCLVLSNNLHLNGWQVETYQNTIGSMQNWFPHLAIRPYPSLGELPRILTAYDWYFVVHNDTDPFVQALITEGKRRFPERIKVLYLYPSPHIVNEPYYTDCLTDPRASIAENMKGVCIKVLHLPKISHSNGLIPPPHLIHRKHSQRIIIHPTSARATRNWPKKKFVKLALHLKRRGYQLVFIPGHKEKEGWQDIEPLGLEISSFDSLDLLAHYIYESGYLVGNDSGLGHLASALQIPTLTLCRRKAWARMWAPSFCEGVVLTPGSWIPNLRGLRLRDRYWQKFITVKMALNAFAKLIALSRT